MVQFNFKDKYFSASGLEVTRYLSDYTYFFSPSYIGGNGSRLSPLRSKSYSAPSTTESALILSGGVHVGSFTLTSGNVATIRHIIGNGIGATIIDLSITQPGASVADSPGTAYYRDLTITKLSHTLSGYAYGVYRVTFYNCEFLNNPYITSSSNGPSRVYISACKLKTMVSTNIPVVYQNNNSFIGISTTIGSIAGSLHTFEKCNLIVTQASLDNYKNNYYAFDNCNFRIGTETDYTPLAGITPENQREAFVARCMATGLTVPDDITDYGISSPLGRWIFTKNQIFEGITWKDSEIYQFEIPRFISFGYSTSRGDKIPVTAGNQIFPSFAPRHPNSVGLIFGDDSLSIAGTVDITQRKNLYADSNIIWLGGKKKLTYIDVPNDLPQLYGILIDSNPNLLNDTGQEVTQIEPGEMYIVRSSDENAASVTYNGSTYSSELSTRNNIFKGVTDATSFVVASGRAVVYKINDILNYQSIQLRIVNKIPSTLITMGPLLTGYWYLVEHNTDQTNKTDYIEVGGMEFFTGDSFLVDSSDMTSIGNIVGNVHLRRCWKQDFDFESEATDKAFWQNEQKPEWCDVLPEDTRCLMYNNHSLSVEMMRGEDGKYITTGHPEYYNKILGASGIQSPDDIYIQGTYMQIRLQITTANPM